MAPCGCKTLIDISAHGLLAGIPRGASPAFAAALIGTAGLSADEDGSHLTLGGAVVEARAALGAVGTGLYGFLAEDR